MRGFRRWLKERSLFSYFKRGNRWFILLVCLFVSAFLWLQFILEEKHIKEIKVALLPLDIPSHFTLTHPEQLPKTLTLTLTADGSSLLSYSMKTLLEPRPKIVLKVDSMLKNENGGQWILEEDALKRQIQKEIPSIENFINYFSTDENKTRTLSIHPSRIVADYAPLTGRSMPIAFTSQVNFGSKNMHLSSFSMTPDVVRVYGIRSVVDSLQINQAVIETDTVPIQVSNAGTNEYKVALIAPAGIKLQPDSVLVKLDTEMLVYDKITIRDIKIDNLSKHYQLRLFPPNIEVTFLVPADSLSKKSYRSEIELFVDANHITTGHEKKLTVQIREIPEQVYMIQLNPGQVEFIVEEPKRQR